MYKSETDTQELKVTFLDDFKITYKDKELSQKSINSDKVTRLLAYLICHKENVVSVGELSDVLWTEGECDDPANALKNLVYTSGFSLNTRAMTTFCWLPPERALHRSCTLGALMANSVRSCSANLRMAEASRRPRRGGGGSPESGCPRCSSPAPGRGSCGPRAHGPRRRPGRRRRCR